MGKLRKILAIFFGTLSALFALVALRNHFSESDCDTKNTFADTPVWNSDLEGSARASDKLVFFKIKNAPHISFDAKTKKTLAENYLQVELDPEAFPADYCVLNLILCNAARADIKLQAGILSPNLTPVYLTARASEKCGHVAPPLESAICEAAKQFKISPSSFKTTAKAAVAKTETGQSRTALESTFSFVPQFGFINSESGRLFILFASPKTLNAPAAIISENARLASRIADAKVNQPAAQYANLSAAEMMCARLSSKRESLENKLLFARALCESELSQKIEKINFLLFDFANELKKSLNKNGLVADKSGLVSVRENAMAVAVLAAFSKISKKENDYLATAVDIASALADSLQTQAKLPAIIGRKSEASSLEYVFLARAFFEIYKISEDKKWYNLSENIISRWRENFASPNGLFSINSNSSLLAKFARPAIAHDSQLPSYLGEAAQLLSEMNARTEREFIVLKRLAFAAAKTSPITANNNASLKLALFSKPFEANFKMRKTVADSTQEALPFGNFAVSIRK